MPRVCFQLRVDPDRLDEYRRRHAAVWPEMLRAIEASGRRNYSLFLRPDGLLIGYYETDSADRSDARLAASQVAAVWEEHMAELFIGGRADRSATILEEVFHLEDQLASNVHDPSEGDRE
ncbi:MULTISPECIES: L-rhamnose mutarotase [unclassified Saccharopolyspora]|uniref:L-rhamnose mutarotase n=1 Tax=Saccharopolyspora TaxID=1835 RepID=UPI00190B6FD4|nr:L-rhamnose mutarotase [Saccharopolyspora sp. HNM0986]MBK0868834.1 L-rhamnose mutarotase [Saccharopolyspora sp. HNM0986]